MIPIELDEERDELIDEMIEEDGKLWLMEFQQEPIKIIPNRDQVDIMEPRRRIRLSQIIFAVFAFIGFIAVVITVYEWIRKDDISSAPIAQQSSDQQPETIEVVPAEEDRELEIIPTDTQIIPTEIPTPEPTSPPKPAVLFEDNFENGLSNAWEIVSGNPMIVNGMLTTDQDTWLMVGDPSWINYSVELTTDHPMSLYGLGTGFNAIGMRAQDIDNMYAFMWGQYQGDGYIVEGGNWNEIPQSHYDVSNKEVNLRFTMVDGTMTVYENGVKAISFFDSRFEHGGSR